jgi:ABC-type nitrate/sulfonate/bicarbonate transport system substrate-binding protein
MRLDRLMFRLFLLPFLLSTVGSHGRSESLPKVVMQLDWKPNVQFAGLLLAQDKGWYREAGLDVEIRPNNFQGYYLDKAVANDFTVTCLDGRSLFAQRAKGLPLKAFATMFQGSPVCFVMKKSKGFTHPRDLVGKNLGIHRPEDTAWIDLLFSGAGLAHPPYTSQRIGFQLQELKSDQVAAAQGYVIDEYVRLSTSGTPSSCFLLADYGYRDYSQLFLTTDAFLKRDPGTLKKFLEVSLRGWKAAFADIEGTAAWVVKTHYPEGDLAYQTASLREIQKLMTRESGPEHLGKMSRETWQALRSLIVKQKLQEHPPTLEEVVTYKFSDGL